MDLLEEPYELMEIPDGQSVTLVIHGFKEGDMVIHPTYAGAPAEKRIHALRLSVVPDYKKIGPPFWDVTSQTLIAQLRPHLKDLVAQHTPFKITAHGEAPRKRFSLEIPALGES